MNRGAVRVVPSGVVIARVGTCLCLVTFGLGQELVEELRGRSRGVQFAAVVERLASDDLAEVAWGGFLAAAFELREANSELRAALRGLSRMPYGERKFASLAVLDALVRADAELPGEELAPFLTGLEHDAAFVLIAREPEENAERLLRTFQANASESGNLAVFLASGHLLAKLPEREAFCVALVEQVRVEMEVHLYDTDERPRVGSGAPAIRLGRGGGYAGGLFEEYPPVATWTLTTEDGDVLVAGGYEPVFACREISEGSLVTSWARPPFDVDEHARRWLAEMLEVEDLELPRRRVVWVDMRVESPETGIAKGRATLDDAFADLVRAARERGLLETAEAEPVRLRIVERVHDHRQR